MASRFISGKTWAQILRIALIKFVYISPPSRPTPQATSQTTLRKKTVDLTGTPVFLQFTANGPNLYESLLYPDFIEISHNPSAAAYIQALSMQRFSLSYDFLYENSYFRRGRHAATQCR